MEENKNNINATLPSVITPTSFVFNGATNVPKILLFEDGCLNFLPEEEYQIGLFFDTYGCASFSFNNCLEIDGSRRIDLKLYSEENIKWLKENYMVNGKLNFSDRDLVVLSGTNPDWGNDTWSIFEFARKNGLICESDEPWNFRSNDSKINNKANYYNYKRTAVNQKKADELLKRFEIKGEWVPRDSWLEASQYGVVQVYTKAWYKRNGKYYNPVPNSSGHGITLVKKSEEKIFDQYDPFVKQLERDEDFYPFGFKLSLIEKTMTKPTIENNALVQLVSGVGGFGLYLDGKILVDDVDKIMATFIVRNTITVNGKKRFMGGATATLQQAEWDMFDKYNLKMEKLS